MRSLLGVGLVLALAMIAGAHAATKADPERPSFSGLRNGGAAGPEIMLWAWERPELLGFIDPRQVGVAYLAETLTLRGDTVIAHPRRQPLRVPPETVLTAVVRVTLDPGRPPAFSAGQHDRILAEVDSVTRLPGIAGLQVDFDSRLSQRAFHRALLIELRKRLPPAVPLSMTALASWCLGDGWLADLPVAEAVPMLFRMGPEGTRVRQALESGRDFRAGVCRQSIGLSTDEPRPRPPTDRRVYVFHPRPWSAADVQAILREVRAWRGRGEGPSSFSALSSSRS